ncbi:MAG: DUF2905 domain-containing protein [bacterium]|nr:DUF2905 domain-containing protein [bacterium]
MANLYKTLIIAGIILVAAGIGMFLLQKFNIPFGKLPGDIVIKNERFSFYFPLTTCIILSIVISLVFFLIRK